MSINYKYLVPIICVLSPSYTQVYYGLSINHTTFAIPYFTIYKTNSSDIFLYLLYGNIIKCIHTRGRIMATKNN